MTSSDGKKRIVVTSKTKTNETRLDGTFGDALEDIREIVDDDDDTGDENAKQQEIGIPLTLYTDNIYNIISVTVRL